MPPKRAKIELSVDTEFDDISGNYGAYVESLLSPSKKATSTTLSAITSNLTVEEVSRLTGK